MKKLVVLTLIMSFSHLLFGAAYDAKINGVYYKFNYAKNTATVARYHENCKYHVSYPDEIVYIPSKVVYNDQEYVVDSVIDCCFRDSYMKEVIFPNTIRGIGTNAFFTSNLERCVIPSGTKYVGNSLLYDCRYLKYFEVGENVISIGNVGSKYQKVNGEYFHNDVVVKWNAIHCCDFKLGQKKYISELGDYFYDYNSETPFWQGDDDYMDEGTQYINGKSKHVIYISDPSYVMRHHIKEFKFGQKVEYIPAYLCYNLQELKTITIPSSVKSIGQQAFGQCTSIVSVVIEALTPPAGNGGLNTNVTVYVPCQSYEAYKSSTDWKRYNIQIIPYNYVSASTSATITAGCNETDITSISIVDGETYEGNVLEFSGLEPNSDYDDIKIIVNRKSGEKDTVTLSYATTALSLITKPSTPVSSTTAILLAETNMADIETSCGFEYKRNDAPDDFTPTKVYCPVASGTMAGRLKNLKDDVYYKYRAFYESKAGNKFYGEWQYIFTGDNTVAFDPILYTYPSTNIKENEATLKGYAIAGAEDFTEQGFEYWADSRVPQANNAPARVPAALGEHKTVQATGIKMQVTLTDLDAGTVYKYRTYAKVGDQVCYGAEMTFTTQGVYEEEEGFELIPAISNGTSRKILYNGQILILRGDRIYTLTGQEVK